MVERIPLQIWGLVRQLSMHPTGLDHIFLASCSMLIGCHRMKNFPDIALKQTMLSQPCNGILYCQELDIKYLITIPQPLTKLH